MCLATVYHMKKVVEVLCIIQLPIIFTRSFLILYQVIVT